MATIIAKSFTATGVGSAIAVKHNDQYTYSVSGTFVGTVILEKTSNGGTFWEVVKSITAVDSATLLSSHSNAGVANYRFRCSAFTSGTIVTSLSNASNVALQSYSDNAGNVVFQVSQTGITAASEQVTGLSTGVLHADSTGVVTSSTVVDADVSASAAIAGSKINMATATPTFSGGNVSGRAGTAASANVKMAGMVYSPAPATVSNSSTTETDLFSGTLAANSLTTNGDTLVYRSGGGLANNANSKKINFYLGAQSIQILNATTANVTWIAQITMTRLDSATVRIEGYIMVGTTLALFDATVTSLDFTAANTIKVTAQGGASADVNAKHFSVRLEPAA